VRWTVSRRPCNACWARTRSS